jgi:hypothetical protein
MASFPEFLLAGRLEPLAWGISPEEVQKLLGPPEDTSVGKKPLIWKFGSAELAFFRNKTTETTALESVCLRPPWTMPANLSWNDWPLEGFATRQQTDDLLRSLGAAWTVDDWDHFLLPSGVQITFDNDQLHSLHSIAPSEPAPQQLSLALAPEVFQRLKEEARKRSTSPAALGAQWIAASVEELQG